jgi:pyruvate formate lyase activating enzyme
MREATLYEKLPGKKVKCHLCNRYCTVPDGKRGFCGVRENRNGKLYSLVYARPVSMHVDPIEKKPLFHFLPGSRSFSIATVGCNFRCLHCQNWSISQARPEDVIIPEVLPESVVKGALNHDCGSISYTYVEPTVFFEYAYDISRLAVKEGLKNTFVTNGYMSKEMLKKYGKALLHAANVDIKGNDEFYRKVCSVPSAEPVYESIRTMHKMGVHVEVTYLVIPGYNDDEDSLRNVIEFVLTLGKEIPVHFSRFHPDNKMRNVTRTPYGTVMKACNLAREMGIHYAYTGNVAPGDPYENTYCPKCGHMVVHRAGYTVLGTDLTEKGKCPECGTRINIVLE